MRQRRLVETSFFARLFLRKTSLAAVAVLYAVLAASSASAQAIKPWFYILLDTSGSMCESDVNPTNSCGFPKNIKMNAAKCAIQNMLNQTGDAEFGLGQFVQNMNCTGGTCALDAAACGIMRVALSSSGATSILPLVDGSGAPAGDCNTEGTTVATGNNTLELCSGGGTPTSGALRMVQSYFRGTLAGFSAPTAVNNAAIGCRPMNVIVLTDGMSNGGGTPATRAGELFTSMTVPTMVGQTCPGAGCVAVPIRTYSIGFGSTVNGAEIEAIATQGGTDNSSDGPGGLRGYYAGDEAELSEALARIVFESQLNEVCNGIDDDCDSRVDEGYPGYCDYLAIRSANPQVPPRPGITPLVDQESTVSVGGTQSNIDTLTCSIAGSMCVGLTGTPLINCCANTGSCCDPVDYDADGMPANLAICASPDWANKNMCNPKNRLCQSPGELCDGEDNDCDGTTDEGPFVGTVPSEQCNDGIDNNCDGNTDEGCSGCVPEICDGDDDDCDGVVDEDLFRPCGYDLGPSYPNSTCEAGQQTCFGGVWGAVCPMGVSNGPTCSISIADGLRGMSAPPPTGWVPAPTGGTCVPPATELCDGLDNDCDTLVDDVPPQACTSTGIPIGSLPRGICQAGQQFCDPNEGDLWGPCLYETTQQTEICNGLDDDCDTFTDEAPVLPHVNNSLTRPCGTNAGICVQGVETCNMGTFQGCNATGGGTETCNRVPSGPDQTLYDEDCDTRIDETDPAIPGMCVPAGNGAPLTPGPNAGRGECTVGNVQCINGALLCRDYQGPTPEQCDAIDSDCDGDNNNGVGPTTTTPNGAAGTDPTLGTPCFPASYGGFPAALPGIGQCSPGRLVCNTTTQQTQCVNAPGPATEICDGIDNDCDASVDENAFPPNDPCQTTPPHNPARNFCGDCVSAGGAIVDCRQSLVDDVAGTVTCQDMGYGAPVSHGGVPDCCGNYTFSSSWDFGDLIGPHNGTNECAMGVRRCINGDEICDGEVIPVDEICDAKDNDCDGQFDETIPQEGQPCGNDTGECTQGQLTCAGLAGLDCVGEGAGGDESCDGLDNDCDGFFDEMNPEGGAQCGGNTENCMRRIDPSNTMQAETEPCGDCDWGVEICVTLFDMSNQPIGGEIQCLGDTGPRPETCDGRDNDCDSKCLVNNQGVASCPPDIVDADDKIDEGVEITDPNVGVGCGETEGKCEEGSLTCTGGGLVCQGGVGPGTEVCNGEDDDCDGIPDDGIPVGAPCGSDIGECVPGVLVCDPDEGMAVCQGGIKPKAEECNNLDDDCDTKVDEGLGLGDACGKNTGLCEKGQLACVNGRSVCTGEIGPAPETCDCEDNDCDGNIDEKTGSNNVCPGTSACIMCQCALPCTDADEFGTQCPQGKAAVDNSGTCYCVGEQCKQAQCETKTIEVQGQGVQCKPESDLVGTCLCRNNECTFRCSGTSCSDGLVCDPTDGTCKEQNCLLPQFACPADQRCAMNDGVWQCAPDACADKECASDEACRDGECFRSCARVSCAAGERCEDGVCVENPCTNVQCSAGTICNPADGECVPPGACATSGCPDGTICDVAGGMCSEDPCLRTHCPYGETCEMTTSQCALRCQGGLVFCDDECIDPQNKRTHCGAALDCRGENAGEQCADGLVCSRGECSDTCSDNLLNCGGECINPQADQLHCGASADCKGANDGVICKVGFLCREGRCQMLGRLVPDAGTPPDGTRVIASGGGGCTCSVPGAASDGSAPASTRGPWSFFFTTLAFGWLARRRMRWMRLLDARLAVLAFLCALSLFGSGCKVDTFCLDCPEPVKVIPPDNDGGYIDQPPEGDGSVSTGDGSIDGSMGGGDAMVGDGGPQSDAGCVDLEICNGLDDDCDQKVDEGVVPADVGIDTNNDVNHCGGCGQACVLPHAFNKCEDAACTVDRAQGDNGCDIGFIDFDGEIENGCEFRCTKISDDDAVCNLIDGDCDQKVDEGVDLANDPNNCGSCNFTCRFANATEGGSCVDEVCELDDTKCNAGFRNLDGIDQNGCEKRCTVFPTQAETCNLVDDDCDGKIDEGVATTDPLVGVTCGTNQGECSTGTTACSNGQVVCQGGVGPATEICDGTNNDCDANTDESDPQLASNPACGSSIGACERGVLQCVGGDIVCGGATFVGAAANETCNRIDDDCDGFIDEHVVIDDSGTPRNLDDGIACSTRSGSLDITPSAAAQGLCVYGELSCQSGQIVCRDEVLPTAEKCDNLDQDCDSAPVPANLASLETTDPAIGLVCGNQLGICEPGETQCVNTGTMANPNWVVQCSPGSVQPEANEECDGEDDDCDGRFDEFAIGVGTNNCHLIDNNGDGVRETYVGMANDVGECDSGNTVCSGGQFACIGYVGPKTETCNGLNDDCDMLAQDSLDTTAFAGTPCNVLSGGIGSTMTWNLVGACTAGTWTCPADPNAVNGLQCVGGVRPAANELCNNIDDDCDTRVDEMWVAGGGQPAPGSSCCPNDPSTPHVDVCNDVGAAFASCRFGANQCAAGTVSCIQMSFSPSAEVCDLADNDCDGLIDDGFVNGMNQYSTINHCGACNNDCRNAPNQIDNAIMACITGSCEIAVCDEGFFDDPMQVGEDCDLHCPFFAGSVELCDGEDNDCDGEEDEEEDLQGPVAGTFCDQDGACAGAVPVCTDIGSGIKGWACDIMPATEACQFNAGSPGISNVDEDCDGRTDEGVTIKAGFAAGAQGVGVNRTCTGPGQGLCQGSGVQICDSMNTSRTTCVVSLANQTEVAANNAARTNEVCDGTDNDCDGQRDEPCMQMGSLCMPNNASCITANTSGGVLGCVIDGWAQLDSDTWIYQHEASRPDASAGTQGVSTDRACGRTNRLPWTNVSYADAVDMCEAAGARLCARAEWRSACSCGGTGATGSGPYYDYGWPSAGACTTNHLTAEGQCNILDSTGTIDASAASPSCYITKNAASVFDLSGNVKELTLAQDTLGRDCNPATNTSCRIQVRGGASNNTAVGAGCGYDRSFWPDEAPFSNVGFRCCSGPDPRVVCTTYQPPLPLPPQGGENVEPSVSDTIVIADTGTVARVRLLNVTGNQDRVGDLEFYLRSPAGPWIILFEQLCGTDDDFSFSMDDAAATAVTASAFCAGGGPVGAGASYRPVQALSAFIGQSAAGTWTFNIDERNNSGVGGPTLTNWSLEICTSH